MQEIVQCKPARFGNGSKYEIKLIGVDKPVWVNEKKLSKGVHKTYQADGSLAKGAKALVNRGFVIEQKEFFKVRVTFLNYLGYNYTCVCCACRRTQIQEQEMRTLSNWQRGLRDGWLPRRNTPKP